MQVAPKIRNLFPVQLFPFKAGNLEGKNGSLAVTDNISAMQPAGTSTASSDRRRATVERANNGVPLLAYYTADER